MTHAPTAGLPGREGDCELEQTSIAELLVHPLGADSIWGGGLCSVKSYVSLGCYEGVEVFTRRQPLTPKADGLQLNAAADPFA